MRMCSCPITNNSLLSVPLLLILDYMVSLVETSLLARVAATGDAAYLLVPSLSGGALLVGSGGVDVSWSACSLWGALCCLIHHHMAAWCDGA